jgi:hypothetical protein
MVRHPLTEKSRRTRLEAPDIVDAHGIPWIVVYRISGSTCAFWSLKSARRVLGYASEDDSEIICAEDIRRLLTWRDAGALGGRVGAEMLSGAKLAPQSRTRGAVLASTIVNVSSRPGVTPGVPVRAVGHFSGQGQGTPVADGARSLDK